MCICRVHMQCPHAECLRRHPISECSASTPDRRHRPGSAPGPPAPALSRLGPVLRRPAPPRTPSPPSSSHPSLQRWPHSESLGPECATTWPAVRRRVALRSSMVGVACRADGCLPSGGRARSESVSASCALVAWVLSIVLIDLPFSPWTHVTFKHAGRTPAGGAARLGVDLHVYARPPWHRRPRDPQGDRGLRAGRRSCVTRAAGRPMIDPDANGFISTGVASPSRRDAPGENPAAAPCGRRA